MHDLDNVVREYLIPNVLEILKPASDYAFTLDDDARKSLAKLARDSKQNPLPPLSTATGVTRYEAWRLPPADEGSEGYVQMALVNDLTGHGDLFGQIDTIVDRWSDKLEQLLKEIVPDAVRRDAEPVVAVLARLLHFRHALARHDAVKLDLLGRR